VADGARPAVGPPGTPGLPAVPAMMPKISSAILLRMVLAVHTLSCLSFKTPMGYQRTAMFYSGVSKGGLADPKQRPRIPSRPSAQVFPKMSFLTLDVREEEREREKRSVENQNAVIKEENEHRAIQDRVEKKYGKDFTTYFLPRALELYSGYENLTASQKQTRVMLSAGHGYKKWIKAGKPSEMVSPKKSEESLIKNSKMLEEARANLGEVPTRHGAFLAATEELQHKLEEKYGAEFMAYFLPRALEVYSKQVDGTEYEKQWRVMLSAGHGYRKWLKAGKPNRNEPSKKQNSSKASKKSPHIPSIDEARAKLGDVRVRRKEYVEPLENLDGKPLRKAHRRLLVNKVLGQLRQRLYENSPTVSQVAQIEKVVKARCMVDESLLQLGEIKSAAEKLRDNLQNSKTNTYFESSCLSKEIQKINTHMKQLDAASSRLPDLEDLEKLVHDWRSDLMAAEAAAIKTAAAEKLKPAPVEVLEVVTGSPKKTISKEPVPLGYLKEDATEVPRNEPVAKPRRRRTKVRRVSVSRVPPKRQPKVGGGEGKAKSGGGAGRRLVGHEDRSRRKGILYEPETEMLAVVSKSSPSYNAAEYLSLISEALLGEIEQEMVYGQIKQYA